MRFGEEREDLPKHSQLDLAKSEPALERRGGERPRNPAEAGSPNFWRHKPCAEATSMDAPYIPVKESATSAVRDRGGCDQLGFGLYSVSIIDAITQL